MYILHLKFILITSPTLQLQTCRTSQCAFQRREDDIAHHVANVLIAWLSRWHACLLGVEALAWHAQVGIRSQLHGLVHLCGACIVIKILLQGVLFLQALPLQSNHLLISGWQVGVWRTSLWQDDKDDIRVHSEVALSSLECGFHRVSREIGVGIVPDDEVLWQSALHSVWHSNARPAAAAEQILHEVLQEHYMPQLCSLNGKPNMSLMSKTASALQCSNAVLVDIINGLESILE